MGGEEDTPTSAGPRSFQQLAGPGSGFGCASQRRLELSPNTLARSVSRELPQRASQRCAAPFSFVSQYASAKRVRQRCEARFPALEARRKASPKRLKQAFQRPAHRLKQTFQRLPHRFTRPRQRLLASFTALRGRKRRRLRLPGAVNGAAGCARGCWRVALRVGRSARSVPYA